jgi:hypothetical protein
VQEQQAAGTMTFWQAVAEFFEFGHRMLWKSPWNGDPPTTVRSRTISGKP